MPTSYGLGFKAETAYANRHKKELQLKTANVDEQKYPVVFLISFFYHFFKK